MFGCSRIASNRLIASISFSSAALDFGSGALGLMAEVVSSLSKKAAMMNDEK